MSTKVRNQASRALEQLKNEAFDKSEAAWMKLSYNSPSEYTQRLRAWSAAGFYEGVVEAKVLVEQVEADDYTARLAKTTARQRQSRCQFIRSLKEIMSTLSEDELEYFNRLVL